VEIDISHLENEDCSQFSDSIANSGLQNIGQITWRNACEHAAEKPLCPADKQSELRSWLAEFGAWSREEIAAMPDTETNALLLQFVAQDLQEYLEHEGTDDFERWNENHGGNIYRCDVPGHEDFGKLFFLMSN